MPDADNNKTEEKGRDGSTRRQFFVRIGLSSIAVAGAGSAIFAYQFLSPNVLYEPPSIVNVGRPEEYEPNSVTLHPEFAVYVVRAPEGFYALSATCTHLGCLTAWNDELGIIACPCHGSKFQRDGTKIAGPAPRPLPLLKMWVNDEGHLMVDRSAVLTGKQYVRV